MSAEGRTLAERLREALQGHVNALYCIREGHMPNGGYAQHLADVTARVVEAWLGEQRQAVAEGMVHLRWPNEPIQEGDRQVADAALAALVAGIEGRS